MGFKHQIRNENQSVCLWHFTILTKIFKKRNSTEKYPTLSNYSVNWTKALCPLNIILLETSIQSLLIPINTHYITYLGFRMSPKLSDLEMMFSSIVEHHTKSSPALDKSSVLMDDYTKNCGGFFVCFFRMIYWQLGLLTVSDSATYLQ